VHSDDLLESLKLGQHLVFFINVKDISQLIEGMEFLFVLHTLTLEDNAFIVWLLALLALVIIIHGSGLLRGRD